jgi:hypothetical protein
MTAEAVRRGCVAIAARARRADGPPGARRGPASQAANDTKTDPSRATATMHASSSGNASASWPSGEFWPNVTVISAPAPPAAPRPSSTRTGCGHFRSACASRSACAGLVRAARRAAIHPLSAATITLEPHAISSSHGLSQAVEPEGSRLRVASACAPAAPRAAPGRQPTAPPAPPSRASSPRIARRTWPRVAPTARSSANLRRRRFTDSAVVPASTNSAIITIAGSVLPARARPLMRSAARSRFATSPRAAPVAIV